MLVTTSNLRAARTHTHTHTHTHTRTQSHTHTRARKGTHTSASSPRVKPQGQAGPVPGLHTKGSVTTPGPAACSGARTRRRDQPDPARTCGQTRAHPAERRRGPRRRVAPATDIGRDRPDAARSGWPCTVRLTDSARVPSCPHYPHTGPGTFWPRQPT